VPDGSRTDELDVCDVVIVTFVRIAAAPGLQEIEKLNNEKNSSHKHSDFKLNFFLLPKSGRHTFQFISHPRNQYHVHPAKLVGFTDVL